MHGLETIKAMNSVEGLDRTRKNHPMASYVEMEYYELINSIEQNRKLGLISQAQYIEEIAEARNTYL